MRLTAVVTHEPPWYAELARLDELFARHPHEDDTTRAVREQRDAR